MTIHRLVHCVARRAAERGFELADSEALKVGDYLFHEEFTSAIWAVVLSALILHEKVHRAQGVGLGLCAVAIALVAGG